MIGERNKQEPLFYYFRISDMIPEGHILRLINKYVNFSFIRNKVRHLYSDMGRPSIDPEVLMRMLLIGYLYGITSERKLCEEVKMHIGYRWFVGLHMNDEVPDHSTFSKNRHGRFKESGIFQEIFDEIVRQCIKCSLVSGEHLTTDSTLVKANASFKSMEPIVVKMKPKEFIEKVEEENPVEEDRSWEPNDDYKHRGEKISNQTHRSKTDPDARLARHAKGQQTKLSHSASYVMDNKSHVIVGVKANSPDRNSDAKAATEMLKECKWKFKLKPKTLGADKGYATGEFVYEVIKEGIIPHVPVMDTRSKNDKGIYSIKEFKFDNEHNEYICPQGKRLKYLGIHKHSRQFVYRAKVKDCKACPVKEKCTKDRSRSLSYHIYEDYLKYAKKQTKTLAYRISQRMRKRIEELFGEAKDYMGLRVAKFRRLWNVKEQFLLTATAQNIKRMAKLLHRADKEIKEAAQEVVTLPDHAIYWLIVTFRSLKMLFRLIICSCYPCELV
jgi:transposase